MNYKKLFGFGVLIWAVVYLAALAFVAYDLMDQLWAKIVVELVAVAVAYLAARNLGIGSAGEIFKYSVSWAVIAFVLDLILTVPFTGWQFFSGWEPYVGYALIILAPLFAGRKTESVMQ